jgi:hypothetical protein
MSRRLLVDLLVTHALVALVVGTAWWALAPALDYRVFDGRAFSLAETDYTRIFTGDAVFVLLAVAAGLVSVGILLLRGHRGPWLPVGLAVGGVLGSVAAWGLGVLLGPGRLDALVAAAEDGAVVTAGPEINAGAALLVWPIVAVAVEFVAAWVSAPEPRSAPASPR